MDEVIAACSRRKTPVRLSMCITRDLFAWSPGGGQRFREEVGILFVCVPGGGRREDKDFAHCFVTIQKLRRFEYS